MNDKRSFFLQALLLTAISLLLRSAGVASQIYVSAQIGAGAVGVSSLIGGVGGFAVTLALSGIQLGCTRLVAQGLGRQDVPYINATLRCAISHALFFGCLSGALLFFGSSTIGAIWIGDMRTVPSLRIMALSLPLIALTACFSGYFVAVRRVWKSGFVQVMEEMVRIACTVFLLRKMVSRGLEGALMAIAVSNAIADLLAGGIMIIVFLRDRHHHFPREERRSKRHPLPTKDLLSVTMPVAIAAYARSGLITLEHMLIPVGLKKFGAANDIAMASYGALQSMALPIVLFPCALLSSFASLLVPEVTQAHVRKEEGRIRFMMHKAFWLSLLFSIGVAGCILCFSNELGLLFYKNAQAAQYIRLLAPLIPVMYIDSATDAILKGLGEQVYSMKVNIADAAASVVLVWILVPRIGIMGYLLTIYITELLNAGLSIVRLINVGRLRPRVIPWVVKPLLCIILATLFSRLIITHIPDLTLCFATLTWQILLTLALYLIFSLLFGCIKIRDVTWLGSFFIPKS